MSGIRFLTAGESHGPALVTVVEGLPAGVSIDEEFVARQLQRRQVGYGRGGRMTIERDRAEFIGGVIRGKTTGAPVAMLIRNRDWANWRDRGWPELTVPRPGHADLAGYMKYELRDCRPVLERASARETAARVAAGSLARRLLEEFAIDVGSFVCRIGEVALDVSAPTWEMTRAAEHSDVRCPDENVADAMRACVDAARQQGESLGGEFCVMAVGVPPGLGSYVQWDCRLDGRLAQAVMSVQAVKGVEIGPAFANASLPGSQVQDPIVVSGKSACSATLRDAGALRGANRAGGLEGGMTTGQPVVIRAAMKPIPTTLVPQKSIDLETGEARKTEYQRSDVCAVPAAAVVAEAMVCLVLAGALVEKFAADSLSALRSSLERYLQLPLVQARALSEV